MFDNALNFDGLLPCVFLFFDGIYLFGKPPTRKAFTIQSFVMALKVPILQV